MGTTSLVILAVGAAVAGLTALLWGVGRHNARWGRLVGDAWAEASRSLGLPLVDRPGERALAGTLEGFEVRVETRRGGSSEEPAVTRATVAGGGRISAEIGLGSRTVWRNLRQAFSGQELRLGDPDFDDAVHVEGPEDLVLAGLGADARLAAVRFAGRKGTVAKGSLTVDLAYEQDGPDEIVGAVRNMTALARALAVASVPEALLENATKDPSPRVRRRNLEVLAASRPGCREALWALQAGLRDLDPELRLFAAQTLSGEGEARGTLEELLDNAALPEALRARALERLAEGWPYEAIAAAVGRALAARSAAVRCAAIRAVGQGRDHARLDTLEAMVEAGPEEAVGEALCAAFEELAGPRSEAALLKLAAAGPPAVQQDAAAALGEVGTVRAVEPLLALARGGPAVGAAREAIRAIQTRLGDAAAGRLSVVGEAETTGQLSVAGEAGQAGAVSVTPTKAPAEPGKEKG